MTPSPDRPPPGDAENPLADLSLPPGATVTTTLREDTWPTFDGTQGVAVRRYRGRVRLADGKQLSCERTVTRVLHDHAIIDMDAYMWGAVQGALAAELQRL